MRFAAAKADGRFAAEARTLLRASAAKDRAMLVRGVLAGIFMLVQVSTLTRSEAGLGADARDRIRAVLSEADAHELAETFRLLTDPGRLRLIAALLVTDELCVSDLAEVTGLSQTACSHNLRLLRAQRLVRYRKQGRQVYYTLDDDHIRVLLDVALQHVTHR